MPAASRSIESITAAYERERATQRPPASAEDLPFSYEAITPAWLTACLNPSGAEGRVLSYELGPIDDGTSNRRALHVHYDDAGRRRNLPERLFCKASQGLKNRITLCASGAAENEVHFYNRVRPRLSIEAPVCYHARYNEALNSIVMLREFDPGTESCTPQTDITRERAEAQLRLLAGLHGAFLGRTDVDASLAVFPTWDDFFLRLSEPWETACDQGLTVAADVVPPRLLQQRQQIWAATVRSAQRHRQLPVTMCHGDCHVRNWYITPAGAMGLQDWQCFNRGHWSRDVIYAIVTSLSVERRRLWLNDLLRAYHQYLCEAAGHNVPLREVLDEVRGQLLSVLSFWTVTIHPAPGMVDAHPPEAALELIRRIATAIDDLDAMQMLSPT